MVVLTWWAHHVVKRPAVQLTWSIVQLLSSFSCALDTSRGSSMPCVCMLHMLCEYTHVHACNLRAHN